MLTKYEMATKLRASDLLKLSKPELDSVCQQFGISARGTREELQERVHKEIWRWVYDDVEL